MKTERQDSYFYVQTVHFDCLIFIIHNFKFIIYI